MDINLGNIYTTALDYERLVADFNSNRIAIKCKDWVERYVITNILLDHGAEHGTSEWSRRFAAGEQANTDCWLNVYNDDGIEYMTFNMYEYNLISFDEIMDEYITSPDAAYDEIDEGAFLNILEGDQ